MFQTRRKSFLMYHVHRDTLLYFRNLPSFPSRVRIYILPHPVFHVGTLPGYWRQGYVPEAVGRVVNGARKPSLWGEVCCQWRYGLGVVAWVVGELDGDGLRCPFRNGVVKMFNGSLCLDALVEADEAHAFGETWKKW